MNLSDTIENGNFNTLGKPDRVIETVISKLFFFGDDVYKVYKYTKAFFVDFSDGTFRQEFYNDDFTWNNTMAPDIYLELGHVVQPEDFFIRMKRIDDSKTLFNLIKKNGVTKDLLERITQEMFDRIHTLTEIKKDDMKDLFETPYVDLDLNNLESTRLWLYMSPNFIPKEEADAIINRMKAFVSSHIYFKNFNKDMYSASIDNHSGNILLDDDNNKVNFIDSMPPMRIWRIQSPGYSISRPATDVEVLVGKEYADTMYTKFEQIHGSLLPKEVRAYFQITAALIQAPYMHVLGEIAFAEKFWKFAKEKVGELAF